MSIKPKEKVGQPTFPKRPTFRLGLKIMNLNGIIVIDKPQSFTSFDVIAVLRKITGQKKLGHTGTLDPNATGVLPVLIGNATKVQDLLLCHDKDYTADFLLGKTTDTLDIWGNITDEKKSDISEDEILKILPRFRGEIEQIPPMFSAVKSQGRRLYDLARQGAEVERKSRKVTVYALELTFFDKKSQRGTLKISCSKGTYVRTIIDDIGRALGTGAVMTALRRTQACGFSLDDCITLENARSLAENGELESKVKSVEGMFAQCGCVSVSDAQARRFSNGGALDIARTQLAKSGAENGSVFRVKNRSGCFLGLGIADTDSGLLKIYFNNLTV